MTGYTNVFGGNTLYPSDVSYIALALGSSVALSWPLENSGGTPAARIIDVTATDAGRSVTLPDATQTAPGQVILFNGLANSTQSFSVLDHGGNTVAAIAPGTQWELYLSDTGTAAGTWRVFQFGASSSTVQASALAGYGVMAIGSQLSQAMAITTFDVGPRTLLSSDRAAMMTWTGTGSTTLNLPTAASVGNGFFASARNSGGGTLTIDPSGGETIDGAATLVLQPGESASFGTQGSEWFSLGFGQSAIFAFDYLDINVGGLSGTYTLAGSELNRTAYRFHGALAGSLNVVVPPTIQQYWVDNSTSGAFNLTLNTATGVAVTTVQGQRSIYYCNGASVVNATTATVAGTIAATSGGTGITSYSVGDMLIADSATSLARLADVPTGNVLLSGGVGVVPAWGKVGLTTHVSGVLPTTSGGTGSSATAYCNLTANVTGVLPIANGGTGASTAAAARTALGAGTVTSVAGTGSVNGLTLTGTVTGSGSITLGGAISTIPDAATLNGYVVGYRGLPPSGTTGTAALIDRGTCIPISASLTIPNGTFSRGDGFSIYNDSASAQTIVQAAGLTLRFAGTASTGNRTLAARGWAAVWFNGASEAIIAGPGLS